MHRSPACAALQVLCTHQLWRAVSALCTSYEAVTHRGCQGGKQELIALALFVVFARSALAEAAPGQKTEVCVPFLETRLEDMQTGAIHCFRVVCLCFFHATGVKAQNTS